MKKVVKLNEEHIRKIIKEVVKKSLNEEMMDYEFPGCENDEIWCQIAKEGGLSYTNKERDIYFYIEEYPANNGDGYVYYVHDGHDKNENHWIEGTGFLHKAQRTLYQLAGMALDGDYVSDNDGMDR